MKLSRTFLTTLLGGSLSLGMVACVQPDVDEDTDGLTGAVIDGTQTSERPEIGWLGGCTATLIRPNVVITAAHCINYATNNQPGNYGSFSIIPGNGNRQSFGIRRRVSWSRGQLGETDVTLMQLSQNVPSTLATPTRVADMPPNQGEEATIFGYGCTNRRSQPGVGTKRKFTFGYGNSYNLCPGDSGGPMVQGVNGPVFGINSGYFTNNGLDMFGLPYQFKEELEAQIREWEEADGDPVQRRKLTVTNSTGNRLWMRCAGDDSVTCSWWTLIEPGQSTWIASPDGEVMLSNRDFGGTWTEFPASAPSDNVTVHNNPENPFYAPGTGPDPEPEVIPEPDPQPDGPAPEPDPQPTPEPEDNNTPDNPPGDPAPQPQDPPGNEPPSDWVDEGGGESWADDQGGDAWADDQPDQQPTEYDQVTCSATPASTPAAGWPALLLVALGFVLRRR